MVGRVFGQYVFKAVCAVAVRRDKQRTIGTFDTTAIGHVHAQATGVRNNKRCKTVIAGIDKDVACGRRGAPAGAGRECAFIHFARRHTDAHNAELGEVVFPIFTQRRKKFAPLQRTELQGRGWKEIDYRTGIADTRIGRGEIAAAALRRGRDDRQCAVGTGSNIDAIGLQSRCQRELGNLHVTDQEGGNPERSIEDGDARTIGLNQNQVIAIEFDLIDGNAFGKADNVVRVRCYRFGNVRSSGRFGGLASGRIDRDRLARALILRDLKCGLLELIEPIVGRLLGSDRAVVGGVRAILAGHDNPRKQNSREASHASLVGAI